MNAQSTPPVDTPNPTSHPVELRSGSVRETQRLGERLGALVQPGDIVLLHGDLGSGKTAFTQGLARGLGVADTVNSPTFTILKEYVGRVPLYHFDLYRIDDPEELLALGFDQYFDADGVCVVEWAERGAESAADASLLWPARWLRIVLRKVSPDERVLACSAAGPRGDELLAALAQSAASVVE